MLVADDQLGDQRRRRRRSRSSTAIARSRTASRYARASAGTQERQFASVGPRRLERVVDVGQVARGAAAGRRAMDEPQVLEGGDMPEIPDERAHQRRVHALEIVVADAGDQRQRALARLGQGRDRVSGGERRGHASSHRNRMRAASCRRRVARLTTTEPVAQEQRAVLLEQPEQRDRSGSASVRPETIAGPAPPASLPASVRNSSSSTRSSISSPSSGRAALAEHAGAHAAATESRSADATDSRSGSTR